MKADLSQPTLGLLRRILEEMQPEETLVPEEIARFWKDTLFDFGFAPTVIEVAASYGFEWGDIISDLFVGRFGRQNSYFSNAASPSLCEQTLKRLAALGLFHSRGTALGDKFRQSLSEDGFDLKAGANDGLSLPEDELTRTESAKGNEAMPSTKPDILVLISHSSKDRALAEALIELLRAGLGLLATQIRCTSVDGYRLPAGVNTDTQLRREIADAGVLVGLLTPNSISSTYVLFELGARWGIERPMIPLLAGVTPEEMRGPHRVLNALSCSSESQLIQFVEDAGRELKIAPQSSSSYLDKVRSVKRLSDSLETVGDTSGQGKVRSAEKLSDSVDIRSGGSTPGQDMVYEESVYWKKKNGEREGPYCPTCYDDKGKVVHLNPGATRGTYRCGACQNTFRTNEYNPQPSRRRPFGSR